MKGLWLGLATATRWLGQALEVAGRVPRQVEAGLQALVGNPVPGRRAAPVRPAEVSRRLVAAMLAPETMLEDARYSKVVPNEYVVELEPATFTRAYAPIQAALAEQWQRDLIEMLTTANQRQSRRAYRFGGPVAVRLQAAPDVPLGSVRIRAQIAPGAAPAPAAAVLELLPDGRRWSLRPGRTVIGRDPRCDVVLDAPRFQHVPLVSGQHAYVLAAGGAYRLFDGAPDGRPSRNGTYLNGRPVGAEGAILRHGDQVVLAPANPADPRPDTPGAAAFRFVQAASDGPEP